jgi:predicted alpha/beta-fold hydrolase
VLFHGLEGCSDSHYARSLARALPQAGWRVAIPHWRGCSGEANRLPRAYHSGDSAEVDWILRRLPQPVDAIGISLGGNALLKWLGERGSDARSPRTAVHKIRHCHRSHGPLWNDQ